MSRRRHNVIVSTFLPGAESDIIPGSRWQHVKLSRPAVVLAFSPALYGGQVAWRYTDRKTTPGKGAGGWGASGPGSRKAAWVAMPPARFLELFRRHVGSEVRRVPVSS